MSKLIIIIMGPGKECFKKMVLDSVKEADEILYWTSDRSWSLQGTAFNHLSDKFKIFYNSWDETDKATNGKCRQRYLEHLKENYPDDWCLALDEDEILDEGGIEKIKEFIKEATPGVYNVKMRHLIGDIGHEDNTLEEHLVPGRLFKISEAKGYPLHSHPMLEGNLVGDFIGTTIWHCGHLPVSYMDYILTRYKQHANDSLIHPPGFLKKWKMSHLFGGYPRKQINPMELPKQILDRYELDADEFYFANRGLETKHFIDAIHWKEFFKPKSIMEVGCGLGPRVYAMRTIGLSTSGFDNSKYAIKNTITDTLPNNTPAIGGYTSIGDITKNISNYDNVDLVIAYDILEHIKYEELDKAIDNIISLSTKNILISVPILGDPNLLADPTHIIKKDKDWWIKQFTDKGLKLIKTPEHFLFKEQVMIFKK